MAAQQTPLGNAQNPIVHEHHFPLQKSLKLLFAFVAVFALGVIVTVIGYNSTQSNENIPEKQTISVTGNADLNIKADKVKIAGWIENRDADLSVAREKNQADVKKLRTMFGSFNLPEGSFFITDSYDSYTTSMNSNFMNADTLDPYPYPTSYSSYAEKPRINVTYTKFEITLVGDQMNKMSQIIEQMRTIQSLTISVPTYSLSNPNKAQAEAKEKAIIDARTQAEKITKVNKERIVKVVSIKEKSQKENYYTNTSYNTQKEINYSASYDVTYEIAPAYFPF